MTAEDYQNISTREKLAYLRKNGSYYDVETTRITIDQLLQYNNVVPDSEPNFIPIEKRFQSVKADHLFACSLFMLDYYKTKFHPVNSIDDLKEVKFKHHGVDSNFYDTYVQYLIESAEKIKTLGLNAKVRVYLSEYLICLADFLYSKGLEVFIMKDFVNGEWNFCGSNWRFLAMGDLEHGRKYTRIIDTDRVIDSLDLELMKYAEEQQPYLWTYSTTDYLSNGIDPEGYWWVTYMLGSHVAYRNDSNLTDKISISRLLTLYYRYGLDKAKYGTIDLYPIFSRDKDLAITIPSHCTNSNLCQYGGDQSFLNSVIMFAIIEEKEKMLFFHAGIPTDEEKKKYHFGYPFPLYNYVEEKGKSTIVYL